MTPQLIAIDLDGTLLTSNRRIHPANLEAISYAKSRGVRIVPASGRIQTSMMPFVAELGQPSLAKICCNGAHVQADGPTDLVTLGLAESEKQKIIDFAVENQIHLNAYTDEALLFTDDDQWGDFYTRQVRTISPNHISVSNLRELAVLKLMFVGDADDLIAHNREIRKRLDPSVVRITESEPEYLEFLSPLADKGRALAALSEHLQIPQAATVAIGDYLNDLEMITWAGIGIAMGNAAEALKSAAQAVAPTNDEAGVAWAVYHVLDK